MIKRVWIFIGGEFFAPEILPKAGDIFIAVDSGIRHCEKMGISPHFHIGDFVSSEEVAEKYPDCEVMRFPTDKDQTDFELALDLATHEYPKAELHIIGSSGGEADHAFGNLLTLKRISAPCYLWQENNLVFSGKGPYQLTFFANKGSKVSVFALEKLENLTYFGLRWTLTKATLPTIDTWCSRNEVIDRMVKISWEKGKALIFLPKNASFS